MSETVEILKVGLSGLVFLLTGYGYHLLAREQQKATPNAATLRTIQRFVWQNVLVVLVVGGFSLVTLILNKDDNLTKAQLARCNASLKNLDTIRQLPGSTESSLRNAIAGHVANCGILTKADQ